MLFLPCLNLIVIKIKRKASHVKSNNITLFVTAFLLHLEKYLGTGLSLGMAGPFLWNSVTPRIQKFE
jgi:hypothetical protein